MSFISWKSDKILIWKNKTFIDVTDLSLKNYNSGWKCYEKGWLLGIFFSRNNTCVYARLTNPNEKRRTGWVVEKALGAPMLEEYIKTWNFHRGELNLQSKGGSTEWEKDACTTRQRLVRERNFRSPNLKNSVST